MSTDPFCNEEMTPKGRSVIQIQTTGKSRNVGNNGIMFQTSVNKGFQVVKDPSYKTVKGMDIFSFTPAIKAQPFLVVKCFRAFSEGMVNCDGSRDRKSVV